jgi:prepilin-type N-terminal cleavage/methylation domain-containing protein
MKKGLTLIEVLVVVALFGLLFGSVFQILSSSNILWGAGSVSQKLENQVRIGLDRMLEELLLTGPGHIIVSGSDITFQVPVGHNNTTGNILWGAQGVENSSTRFFVDGSNFLRRQLLNSGSVLSDDIFAHDIQSLNCSTDSTILNISLTAQSGATSRQLGTSIRFRN